MAHRTIGTKNWPLIMIGVLPLASAMLEYGPRVLAQSTTVTPKFEVASIRAGCGNSSGSGAPKGAGAVPSPGRFNQCGVLRSFIQAAYVRYANGRDNPNAPGLVPIEGGPDWIRSDRYQINAKPEGNPRPEMIQGPMLQALLEDRFKLKIRRETRDVPVYALIVSKGGTKLQKFQEGSCIVLDSSIRRSYFEGKPFCALRMFKPGMPGQWDVHGGTLDDLARALGSDLDRIVINQTGVAGTYDFHLEFAPDQTTIGLNSLRIQTDSPTDPAGGLSVFTAIQQQLGLKLESAKGPREFLVIDHAERPSDN
jgi:uncharacterized protein (TIGR03435 family)